MPAATTATMRSRGLAAGASDAAVSGATDSSTTSAVAMRPATSSGAVRACSVTASVVPAGAVVSTQAYSMHHDPDLFPDPDRFWPERWERPTKAMRDAFMPFGGTSRSESLPLP